MLGGVMKNISLALLILFTISILLTGCDGTCPPEDENYATLTVKWDGEVIYNETLTEDDHEASLSIDMPDGSELNLTKFANKTFYDPNDDENWQFGCLASKEGFYSILPDCGELQIIEINGDTDFTETDPGMVCGLVYNNYYGPIYSSYLSVLNKTDSSLVMMISSLNMGRYSIDLPFGEYLISYDAEVIEYNVDSFYQDIELVNVMMVDKPNIYLYPEEETQMDVEIDFPKGGKITVSDPPYVEGWNNITVNPDGKINGKHDFLFYESATSEFEIPEAGWIIPQTDLKEFFINNMEKTGFEGREIDDFIQFWIPIFKEHKYYEIYPLYQKELDEKIQLKFSKKPDSMQRLIYIVKGREDGNLKLSEPVIPAFERKGFVVAEWGVIRK